jgi:hypothetical protein
VWARRSRDLTALELVLLVIGACLFAVLMHWPLVLHLGETIPKDLGDPLPQSWQIAWGGHALAHQPLHAFQSNQFWPLDDTLAFSDALLGYAPAGLIGSGPQDAVARYDVLFLLAYALAFAGAYLLARELGAGPGGAAVAGAAFAFAPFRLEQDGHMQVISSGGIALALALGARGLRLRRPLWLMAGFLVAAWQLSLGFTLGLPFAYLLAALALIAALGWLWRGRPALDRRLVHAAIAGAAIFVCATGLLARPYVRVADEHPQATRSPAVVAAYSGDPAAFLAAPDESLIWGGATASVRDGLANVPEQTLFPGLVTLALAAVGIGWRGCPRWLRLGLAASVIAIWVLALGFREEGGLLWPYRIVYDVLPGWQGIRTPGRLVTFSSLALALLAAGGAERLLDRFGRRERARPWAGRATPPLGSAPARRSFAGATARPATPPRRLASPRSSAPTWRSAAITGALALALAIEGRGLPFDPTASQAQPRAPQPPADVSDVPAPQLHLPAGLPADNRRYLLWSTDGFPDLVNGRSSVEPRFTERVIERARGFPSASSVAFLRGVGVRSVIVDLDRAEGTPFHDAASRPVAGLGVVRGRRGALVVYELGSESASSPPAGSDSPADSPRRSR